MGFEVFSQGRGDARLSTRVAGRGVTKSGAIILSYCDHCGRKCNDFAGGWATIFVAGQKYNVCHPNAKDRPDCYRLITMHGHSVPCSHKCYIDH